MEQGAATMASTPRLEHLPVKLPYRSLFVVAFAWALAGCAGLPPLDGRTASFAPVDTAQTRLGRTIAPLVNAHATLTGVHALTAGPDAFAARMMVAAGAERTLDLQYYIWRTDESGWLLLERVWRAAERGVRVRLLLDDATTRGMDETIAALDAHPNIEVRLYNPLAIRSQRGLNALTDFSRLNRRMHNKALIADNQVMVVGGRNIGNEYFGAKSGIAFSDLDVLAVGAAVPAVSESFDVFWNSPSAYPAALIVAPAAPDSAQMLEARFTETHGDPDAQEYLSLVNETALVQDLAANRLDFEWAHATVVGDDPAKTLDPAYATEALLLARVLDVTGRPTTSFDLISPYLVPGEKGTEALAAMAARGVTIRVLTNSMNANDVLIVHSGYAKRRCDMVRAGIHLYELKATGGGERRGGVTASGSGVSSLHAKTFATDQSRIFVGSFNFDLRSARLNTELGLVIDSPVLARRLGSFFDVDVPYRAYELRPLEGDQCIEWIERKEGSEVHTSTEPETTLWRRVLLNLASLLPIDWLL